jgi:hypothetical protein
MPTPKNTHLKERYTQEWVDKLVAPEFPRPFQPFMEGTSSAYFRAIESVLTEKPYPVRAIMAPGTQPVVSTRGSKRVVEALQKLNFFVVIEVMRTAEMAYADVVVDELRAHPTGIVYPMKPMVYEKYEKIFSAHSSQLSRQPKRAFSACGRYPRRRFCR